MSSNWTTIESDPGVFTNLVERFGCKGVEFSEVFSMDDDFLPSEAYGLIFLFKFGAGNDTEADAADAKYTRVAEEDLSAVDPTLFFARQVIHNACATQAILSILLNVEAPLSGFEIGRTLSDLKAFTAEFPPNLRGEMIGNTDAIREAHNSFSRQDPFVSDEKVASDSDEVFHFIAYVPHQGRVYELDGLKPGPMILGELEEGVEASSSAAGGSAGPGKAWMKVARERIQHRIAAYAASEIKFNLLAVVEDQRMSIRKKLEGLEAGSSEARVLEEDLLLEEQKRKEWEQENERRQHNYVPFILELLSSLASKGNLREMVDSAEKKDAEKKEGDKVKASG